MKILILIIILLVVLMIVSAFLFAILPINIYKDEKESIDFDRVIEDGFTTFKNKSHKMKGF